MTHLSALIAGFELDQRRRNLATTTIQRRTNLLRKVAANHDLATVTPDQIAEWLDSLHKGRLVAASRRAYMADLDAFFTWAHRRGHLPGNPFDERQRPRVPRGIPRPIPDDELGDALGTATPKMRCWLLLGALAGLRSKEIAGLAAEHLLWHEAPPLLIVFDGKGHHQRIVPIAEQLEVALKASGLPRAGFLFCRQHSAMPISAAYVSHAIAKHLHACGSSSTAHRLRHHFGTRVYQATHDIRAVQELLGHQSSTTTSIYAQWSVGAATAAVRGLRA